MSKISAVILTTCACLLLSTPAHSNPTLSNANETNSAADTATQLKQTLAQLNALDKWFSESEARRNRWLVEIRQSDDQVSRLSNAVENVRQEISSINTDLQAINQHNKELQNKRQAQAKLVAQHVVAAYRLSGQDFLKQLLNQESPDKFDRMIRYHQTFSESRLKLLDEYKTTLSELIESNAALQSKRDEQIAERERLQAEQDALTGQRQSRARLISQLDAEIETKQEEYQRLQADQNRLENLLAELRRRAAQLDGGGFVAAKGTLPMPVQGSIRHAFGSYRAEGRLRWHGIDIRADLGAPVYAVYGGRVVFADWLRGFGLLTILDHGGGYMTLYGHADSLMKQEGDLIEGGEMIATAGNSGGRNDVGIYFEVRHKGDTLDPISWVRR